MEFITQDDLNKIKEYAKNDPTPERHLELKAIYVKLEHLCKEICKDDIFKFKIRKNPKNQGRKFEKYQWAKIYPTELYETCLDKFAYIVGFDGSLHFHLRGINSYENKPASLEATNTCWTEIDIDNSSYEEVANEFVVFDKKYRDLFLKTGAALNVEQCIQILKNKNMKETVDLLYVKKQMILQGPPGTGKTYSAKNIAYNLVFDEIISTDSKKRKEQLQQLSDSDQYKLIQFHPSYSYEDFVRGITAKSNGTSIEYKTENKVLAKFAATALKNYLDSKKTIKVLSKERAYENILNEFKEKVQLEIDTNGLYSLSGTTANIVEVTDESFRYNFPIRVNILYNMLFSDIISIGTSELNIDKCKDIDSIKLKMKGKSPYYFTIYNKIEEYINDQSLPKLSTEKKEDEKNYILVIDEINRANLPSVLGELIYALEYRNEPVESMYDLDEDRKIILPPNLYIIGTMNTADRSVGHIDYAIRRRFAFVDVLPSPEPIKEFAKSLFQSVSELFVKNYDQINWTQPQIERSEDLAMDFRPEDVWIGHSYFLTEKDGEEGNRELAMKLQYEVLPILKEYLKDGILMDNESVNEKIKNLHA
jgi:MoxR-like ATPase